MSTNPKSFCQQIQKIIVNKSQKCCQQIKKFPSTNPKKIVDKSKKICRQLQKTSLTNPKWNLSTKFKISKFVLEGLPFPKGENKEKIIYVAQCLNPGREYFFHMIRLECVQMIDNTSCTSPHINLETWFKRFQWWFLKNYLLWHLCAKPYK